MTKYFRFSFLIFLLSAQYLQGQNADFQTLRDAFQENNYQTVIALSDGLLNKPGITSVDTLISILEMKAVSLYAVGEVDSSKFTFIELLKIDPGYEPDPSNISPKIIDFFNPVKNDFTQIVIDNKSNRNESENLRAEFERSKIEMKSKITGSVWRSLIFPGWGHIYRDKYYGWFIAVANAALLGGSIYFTLHTNTLENNYLSASDKSMIEQKYKDFNSAYKIRNGLYIAYAALWIFTQTDILFFTDEPDSAPLQFGLSHSGLTLRIAL
ncbi:MAG: hypothetical protein K9J16_12650 [Melioribacteraceae bacterium]|nr:hypothetical protein [Melioribacteraceae bacterium]MCF8356005.1 hypothetical protein [Melioribacteraceae bacterium]MCF8394684.1 hypothetical protein [Melioribacteraceae bacterium]MCF8420238.1 hypothetical protein [Melioribacteraceae bacterium]